MTGFPLIPRLTRGLIVAIRFLVEMNPILPVLVVALILLRRDWRLVLLGLMFAGCLFYSIWVGGDFVEGAGGSNRFISIAMPLFFVLLACVLDSCASFLAQLFADYAFIANPGAAGILAVLTVLAIVTADLPVRNETPGFSYNDVISLPCAALLLINPPTAVGLNEASVELARTNSAGNRQGRPNHGGRREEPLPISPIVFMSSSLGRPIGLIAKGELEADGARRRPSGRNSFPGHFKWDYSPLDRGDEAGFDPGSNTLGYEGSGPLVERLPPCQARDLRSLLR